MGFQPVLIWETRVENPCYEMQRKLLTTPLIYLLLCSYMVLVIYPMFWLFYSSLKTDQEIFLTPFQLPTALHFENFRKAWVEGHFGLYFANSMLLTFSTVLISSNHAATT